MCAAACGALTGGTAGTGLYGFPMTIRARALAAAGSLALLGGGIILGAAPAQALSCPPGQVMVDLGAMGQACQAGGGGGNNGSGGSDYGGGGGSGPGTVTVPPAQNQAPYGPTPGYQPPVQANPPAQTYVPPAPGANQPAYTAPGQAPAQQYAPVAPGVPAGSAPAAAGPGVSLEAGPGQAEDPAAATSTAAEPSAGQVREAKTARIEEVRDSVDKAVLRALVAASVEKAMAVR